MTAYAIVVEPMDEGDGGGYAAFFPDLPGCMSDGETELEAVANALDAFKCWMEIQTERGAQIPEPGDLQREALKADRAMEAEIERLRGELADSKAEIARLKSGRIRWAKRAIHQHQTSFHIPREMLAR